MAPKPLAAPIAASPATPAPIYHDFRGWHLARGGDLPREKAAEMLRRFDDRSVAGDVSHRAQRIELLRTRDARHHIHRNHRHSSRLQPLDQIRVLRRPDKADQCRALAQQLGFMHAEVRMRFRRANFEDDVGLRPKLPRLRDNVGTGFAICVVGELRQFAGTAFDRDGVAEFDDLFHRVRRRRYTTLARVAFFWDGDFHFAAARSR
jgi:hypothetical protein